MTDLADDLKATIAAMLLRIPADTQTPVAAPDAAVWAAVVEAGFTGVDVPEDAGGHGGELGDALAVLETLTEAGAVTPYLEHALLASWLAGGVGHPLGDSTATVAVIDDADVRADGDRILVSGKATGVTLTDGSDVIVALAAGPDGPLVAVIARDAAGVEIEPGTDLQGVSYGDIVFRDAAATFSAPSPVGVEDLRRRGALAYTVALAAAARAVREHTVRYASERTQFGRPLAKFQAIQQRLAEMAAQTTLMETAARAAVESTSGDPARVHTAVAAAKVVTSRYATEVASAGYQIHGAIGFTSEHSLGRFTTGLWTWSDRYGTGQDWAESLAREILDDGADPWDVIAGHTLHPPTPGAPFL
ncbi:MULTISPECIES: acyl-CoA dehydrogenase family protein [Gordonia]|uniref:acyl-CoA dehydrogenase family protein n=1 Tax=Gordonia TaxID=2053 RepID=UPI0013314319|nr:MULTISPECIES: acyl-CoA dehydrogenase family protein [Gordonia]KAF0970928.1 Crotonobetainyl-CoA reductase [Gordonia sp. YY1]MCZ4580099.1 acyl-CoA dehydrogenase family protein [Gordonia amicalis]